jgi:hypothetical protein
MKFIISVLTTIALLSTYKESFAYSGEICYTSTNNRGEGFWLHINYDKYGRANRIRYNDKKASIPLSFFGKERKYFSIFNSYIGVTTYYETYRGKVTGILYITDDVLDEGINVIFERVKDGQIFIFQECDYPQER